jgi:hypothetical protein
MDSAPRQSAPQVLLSVRSPALLVCGALLLALTAAVGWLAWKIQFAPQPGPPERAAAVFSETIRRYRTPPGPWGELEFTRISLARPDPYLYVAVADTRESRWRFTGQSFHEVEATLEQAGFSVEEKLWLLDPVRCQSKDDGWVITPGAAFLLGMSRPVRERLYAVLALDEANPYHAMPLSWRADGLDEWLEGEPLSDRTVELVQRLLYLRGEALCFSDMPAALSQISDEAEQKRLIKTLSSNNSVLIKLRVPHGADVTPWVEYWGKGGRAKDVRPLLESLAQVPGGATVDISHLLPSLPRSNLFTYEYPARRGTVSTANCFWTAMNFFNSVPDDRFADLNLTLEHLRADYELTELPPSLGDVLMFEKPGAGYIHAAVYIADSVVFTKNGHHHTQPWLLMRLDDLLARYPASTQMRIERYRSKAIWEGMPRLAHAP